jgi:uncharacterized protein
MAPHIHYRAQFCKPTRWILALLMLILPGGLSCRNVSGQSNAANDDSFSARQVPLIFPGMSMQGTDAAHYQLPDGGQRLELRAHTGERIEALFCPASPGPGADSLHRPTVIYFYGNAQCLATALDQVELLRRCGANVLIADYLGFGLSDGKPSEAGCYAVATALYDHALARRDIDNNRLIAAGWSLGAAVAIDLANRRKIAGLITFSAYTSKRDMARLQFPSISPMAIEHPFLNRDKIRNITCPTLIVHGRRDTLVPFSMAEELRATAAGKPITYLPVDDAGHNDLFLIGGKQLETAISTFVAHLSGKPATTLPSKQDGKVS